MQLDTAGLAAQQAAEKARKEAGKLGMKVLQQQMQVGDLNSITVAVVDSHSCMRRPHDIQ